VANDVGCAKGVVGVWVDKSTTVKPLSRSTGSFATESDLDAGPDDVALDFDVAMEPTDRVAVGDGVDAFCSAVTGGEDDGGDSTVTRDIPKNKPPTNKGGVITINANRSNAWFRRCC
jgi:hypothetical protein